MTDSYVSNSSTSAQPPLSPELNFKRSFKRGFRQKTQKLNNLTVSAENAATSSNYSKKADKTNLESCRGGQAVVNEIDSLLEIEQHRKSLYDRICMSKEIPQQINFPQPTDNITKRENIKLPISKSNVSKTCVNSISDCDGVSDYSTLSAAKEEGFSSLEKFTKNIVESKPSPRVDFNNAKDNSFKMISKVNSIFTQENFDDLKVNTNFGGFLKASNKIQSHNSNRTFRSAIGEEKNEAVEVDVYKFDNTRGLDLTKGLTNCNSSAKSTTSAKELDKDIPKVNALGTQASNRGMNIFRDEDFSDLILKSNKSPGFNRASSVIDNFTIPYAANNSIENSRFIFSKSDETCTNLKNPGKPYCGFTNSLKISGKSQLDVCETSNSNIATKNTSTKFQTAENHISDKDFGDDRLPTRSNLVTTKRSLNLECSDVSKTLISSIFKDEDLTDLKSTINNVQGFQKASNQIQMNDSEGSSNQSATKNTSTRPQIAKNLFADEDFGDLPVPAISNLVTTKRSYSDESKKLSSSVFKDEDLTDMKSTTNNVQGFQKSSNQMQLKKLVHVSSIHISTKNNPTKFEKARNIFADEDFSDLQLPKASNSLNTKLHGVHQTNAQAFSNITDTKDGKPNNSLKNKTDFKKSYADIFKDIDLSDITPIAGNSFGVRKAAPFSKLSNKGFKITTSVCEADELEKNDQRFENLQWIPSSKEVEEFQGFDSSDQNMALVLGKMFLDQVGETDEFLFKKCEEMNSPNTRKRKLSGTFSEPSSAKKIKCDSDDNQSFIRKPKKRLGTHFTPSITMSTTSLDKTKCFFKEELSLRPVQTSTPILSKFGSGSHMTPKVTPIRYNHLTPIKEEITNISTRLFFANESSNLSLTEKSSVVNKFGLNKPTEGKVYNWLENLDAERKLLEERLRVVCERHDILQKQEQAISHHQATKRKPGCLYLLKNQNDRCELRSIGEPGLMLHCRSSHKFLNMINPQNAGLVHFGIDRWQSFIKTSDGAIIVPNSKGQVGVSEIEHSFSAMDGVDPKLLPDGWIKNHYKWIIWKLASYERMYPDTFQGVFSLENVVQQLKYRYDREIDEAERPALKKIFEKDDCPQKRLILCVSSIKKLADVTRVNDGYELGLTDGWYPIRAVIDKPLSHQIKEGKIKIGTKIITCGAEMMNNNDGCDPLEASNDVCLNISYNSTRRALWWTKLGFQKDPSAFRIPLSSVDLEGGRIGCIQFYVARVYPAKYLEKLHEHNVWRNFKAEERKAIEWENEQSSKIEEIWNHVNHKMQASSPGNSPVSFNSIEAIEDPEILHKILENSRDPEIINGMLSSSQRSSLLAYQTNKSIKEQSRIINEVHKKVGIAEKRNVTPLLRIRIVDATGDSENDHNFYVWNPQEYHFTILREGSIVSAFNVNCNTHWGLTAGKTTKFKGERRAELPIFQHLVRRVTKIDDLRNVEDLVFKEFDTVGIVIRIKIAQVQEVWLSSISGRLLLIKIYESTQNILLLDAIREEGVAVACNITLKEAKDDYVYAVADHYSIISKYSKLSGLQEELANLCECMEKIDMSSFVQSALSKITDIERKSNTQSGVSMWNGTGVDDGMDCSQMTTTDIALLECVSKLEA